MSDLHIALFIAGFIFGAITVYLWNHIPYSSGHIDGFRDGWKACKDGKECI